MTKSTSLQSTILILAAPTLSMLVGSFIVLYVKFSKFFQAMMQNFSAGLLISAIGSELFPLLQNGVPSSNEEPSNFEFYCGTISGFVIGIVFMFAIDFVVDLIDEEEDEVEKEEESKSALSDGLLDRACTTCYLNLSREIPNMVETLSSLQESIDNGSDEDSLDGIAHRAMYTIDKARRSLTKKIPLDTAARNEMSGHVKEIVNMVVKLKGVENNSKARRELIRISNKMKHLHDDHTDLRFSRWKSQAILAPAKNVQTLPYATIFAVVVDAAVDGILIGLALSAEHAAGISMAIATVIEMGFLGVSFSAQIKSSTNSTLKHIIVCMVPPLFILGSGVVGHEIGNSLQENEGVFIGFIAFSIVAILFLVTQELLREAQEFAGENVLINVMFFVGLLFGVLMDRALG